MGTYSHTSIRAQKGEATGTKRDYDGRYAMTYAETMEMKLTEAYRMRAHYQEEFDRAQQQGDAQRIGDMAIALHREQKRVGNLEVVVAQVRREVGEVGA